MFEAPIIYEERWYQCEAEAAFFNYFGSGKVGNPLFGMPTGTGKSLVIAKIIKSVFYRFQNQRVMMLTHVKKLIEQNANKLLEIWPNAPLGIHSAGLNSREFASQIIYGGIQSIAPFIQRCLKEQNHLPAHQKHFGWRDLVFIDEAHLVSPEVTTQYQYVISELRKINPYLKVIGFSATLYRTKDGDLSQDGGIFNDIAYDITDVRSFNRLIAEGYLAPLIAKPTHTKIDTTKIKVIAGEYNGKQAEAAINSGDNIVNACSEICYHGYDRQAWIIFADGINNAEIINEVLIGMGIVSTVVHSKNKQSDKRIRDYQAGYYQCLVNKDMLTTGFDHPQIDLIADLQPTMSPGKHVQKGGRGTRPYRSISYTKTYCLWLDFVGNTKRLGPINDPVRPTKSKKIGEGDAPVRICDKCGIYNHAKARYCGGIDRNADAFRQLVSAGQNQGCGEEFSFENKIFATAGTDQPLRTEEDILEYFNVSKVIYNLHEKKNAEGQLVSPPMIKVTYFCGLMKSFNKYIMLEHGGRALSESKNWWMRHHPGEPPKTTYEALQKVSELRQPSRIRVLTSGKYPEIMEYEYA